MQQDHIDQKHEKSELDKFALYYEHVNDNRPKRPHRKSEHKKQI